MIEINGILKSFNSKSFLLAVLMAGIILVIFSYTNMVKTKAFSKKLHAPKYLEMARNRSEIEGVAYVFMALGAQANQMNCPAVVESLVKFGGWSGDVYFLTDRGSCFNPDDIIANAEMKKEKFHYIQVDESFSSGGIDLQHPMVGFRKSRVRSFEMKTRLFDFVKDPKIHTIAYADCDILFADPGCPQEFVRNLNWTNSNIKFTNVVKHNVTHDLLGLHAGSLIVHRQHSHELLKAWRAKIHEGTTEGDNDAFIGGFHEYEAKHALDSTISNPFLADAVYRFNKTRFEGFINTHEHALHCMNHISKKRCLEEGRQSIQNIVDRFQLKTYQNKYYYCTHESLQPLLYGWFPFKYVPFCPKLETFL